MKGSEIQIKDIMTRIQHVKWGFLEEKGGEIICISIHIKVGNKSCLIDPYGHVDWFGDKPPEIMCGPNNDCVFNANSEQ